MATLTVNIHPDYIDFTPPSSGDEPNSTVIYPGDVLTFALVDRGDAVTVTFPGTGDHSPFSTDTVQIPGGTQKLSAPKTVRADVAASATYHFNAPKLSLPEPGPDQPGTLSGGLEVGMGRPPELPGK